MAALQYTVLGLAVLCAFMKTCFVMLIFLVLVFGSSVCNDESCPALYSPPNKTLYIAERWKGFVANSITHNVLHECCHAYDHLKGNVSASDSFRKAIESDGDQLTSPLRTKFHYDRVGIAMRSRELYAEFFATACTPGIDKSTTVESRWYWEMSKAFPMSFKFVQQSIRG